MIPAHEFTRGQFTYTAADGSRHEVKVDFNPASLDYTLALNAQGEGGQTQQAAGIASAKLNLELVFDTTDTGDDVRTKTSTVEAMLRPQPVDARPGRHGPPHAPPLVTFEWGAFKFAGLVDAFKQTMDFFAPNGLPLRATVGLTMSQPNYQFDQQGAKDEEGDPLRVAVDQAFVLSDGDPSQLAADAGNPFAARSIAAANGLESLRGFAGASLAIGGALGIGAPVAFSRGALAAAPVAEAFGKLHAAARSDAGSAPLLAPARLLAAASAPGIAPGAVFDVTGRAVAQGASTFKADVGIRRRLRFDES